MDNTTPSDDLSALAWVHGELRRSLETAHKALRRYLKEAEAASGSDVDAVDPAVLRTARSQLHQGVGALELVGMPAVADVLRASEAAVQRLVARPATVDAAAVDTIERVSFALLDFLGRQLAGKPVSPVLLFPQYRAALQLAATDRIHPADLWKIDWQWRALPPDPSAAPRHADDAARGDMETLVLALMRLSADGAGRDALARMSDLCADLGAGARVVATGGGGSNAATFWQLAAAVFEAQATTLLVPDVYSKRLASRLMAQLRMRVKGQDDISDRLAQDLLFFCSHARAPVGQAAPRLRAVRQVWRLAELPTGDYDTPRLGRFDPAVMALARKRVAAAKDAWSAVAGAEMHRLTGLAEQFVLVGESLQRLLPAGDVLARALQTAVAQTVAAEAPPPAALAMEVATGILYLDASLEDGEFDHPELAARVEHLARRIDDVRIGAEPQPLDVWMEELYRRVSDRQTMGSVVQELRASLSEIEKQIDQYFRDPSQRQLLIPVPAQLSAMRGVLSVLGLEQASAAALHMRDEVDALAQTEVDPARAIQAGTFDRLADNLGALSFLIDMLAVQPQLAKSLFRYDPDTGNFSAVMGQSDRVSAFAAFDEGVPQASATQAEAPASGQSQAPLLEQLQAVAVSAALASVSDDDIARRLEPLAQQAYAAEQPELARLLASAQRVLSGDPDADPAGADPGGAAATANRAEVRAELAQAVAALAPPAAPALPPYAPVPPPAASPVPAGASGLEDDAEMRDIFIEEAREVITDATAALERLADEPDNSGDMTAVRRAFHTLKGSARMVGLRDFGDAGWACEQLYNARLAQTQRMDAPLRQFSAEALAYMADWTEAIAAGRDGNHAAATVARAADALREHGVREPIVLPVGMPDMPAAAAAVVLPRDPAPLAVDLLDLHFEPAASRSPAALDMPDTAAAPEPALTVTDPWPELLAELDGTPAAVDSPTPTAGAAHADADAEFAELPGLDLDFEFDLPPSVAALPAVVVVEAEDPHFDLDLGDFGDPPAAQAEEPAAASIDEDPAALAERDTCPVVDDEDTDTDTDTPLSAAGLPPLLPRPSLLDELAQSLSGLPDLPLELPLGAQALDAEAARAEAGARSTARLPTVDTLEIDLSDLGDLFADAPEFGAAPQNLSDFSFEPIDDLPQPLVTPSDLAVAAQAPVPTPAGELSAVAEPAAGVSEEPLAPQDDSGDEQVKVIGPLRIGIPLFNIYLNEADELSRRLGTELDEWAHESERHPVPASSVALAHSLAGSSATVGYVDLSSLARALEHALERSHGQGYGRPTEPELFNDAADEIRRLLHQFAAGFLRPVAPVLMERLAAHERWPVAVPTVDDDATDAVGRGQDADGAEELQDLTTDADSIDTELFPIFEEEADELLPQLHQRLRDWADQPAEQDAPMACMRTLHTVKGGARLAGAMRLGEMAHRLETLIETLAAQGDGVHVADIEPLLARADAMSAEFDRLRLTQHAPKAVPATAPGEQVLPAAPVLEAFARATPAASVEPAAAAAALPAPMDDAAREPAPVLDDSAPPAPLESADPAAAAAPVAAVATPAPAAPPTAVDIDWERFSPAPGAPATPAAAAEPAAAATGASSGAVVRVRAGLLDRLVNQAGEVSITRARIDANVKLLQGSLGELTDSLERMRRQLHDIELQAETQISSRLEAAKVASAAFDPLEMDRFTRFQELTRFMAESVNDVATLQRSLQRTLQNAEDELAAQARLTRELQDDLLRTRMVDFDSMADRLHRTARQAARDSGKQVKLDIVGGAIEIDRGVLERMVGSFEHLLRNSVAHGVESPAVRVKAGKDATGVVTVTVAQAGNEVAVEFADDGAGLDLSRIRNRGVERGLVAASADGGEGPELSDAELAQLIFQPGFSTADSVTELAGRGVGLDVVRAEVNGMGGRIQTSSEPGRGTRFKLLLPLTTAVTQVVMLRCGALQVAVPSTLIESVQRTPTAEVERAYADSQLSYDDEQVPFYWLAALLRAGARGESPGRTQTVVVIRSAAQRVALHVDEVVGNQEVVVKNVGPQLSRLPGLAGVTLLPSGAVALIYNPVALASLYGDEAHARMRQGDTPAADGSAGAAQGGGAAARVPLVLVVDDSLTVRRVTQRLLVREGYRVDTAKDGLEALERLAVERPVVLLSDIEMPRMDGFDLLRNVRADAKLAGLPVVMITSRIAQKHRDYAAQLGVDHYLGKPYAEEELLALVARYAGAEIET